MPQVSRAANFNGPGRPYRSHLVPACTACRRRKIRCHVDSPSQACRLCLDRGLDCSSLSKRHHSPESPRSGTRDLAGRFKHRDDPSSISTTNKLSSSYRSSQRSATEDKERPSDESSVIIEPALAEDVATLQHYLTAQPQQNGSKSVQRQYRLVSADNGPIVYLSVQRPHRFNRELAPPGSSQLEIIEQILGSLSNSVLELYLKHFHPCFPVVDEQALSALLLCNSSSEGSKFGATPTLLCEIYAASLIFWPSSTALRKHTRPDMEFVWSVAVAALHADFASAPALSTVSGALLDLCGRPVFALQSNILTAARTLALAQSLGLHRNPASWQAADAHEKALRVRAWWGVRVHDAWASLAHGTPPGLMAGSTDVPLPPPVYASSPPTGFASSSVINADGLNKRRTRNALQSAHVERRGGPGELAAQAAQTFPFLCSLSAHLADMLPLVYGLDRDVTVDLRAIQKSSVVLDDWEAALPASLSVQGGFGVNGSANLRFCLLSLRLLLCRLSLRATKQQQQQPQAYPHQDWAGEQDVQLRYWTIMVRSAACNVIDFVIKLDEQQCAQFWLPYTAHLLVSAATMLLRSAVDPRETRPQEQCITKLHRLLEWARHARSSWGWDLGVFMLDRCADVVEQIASRAESDRQASVDAELEAPSLPHQALDPDFNEKGVFLPADSLDFSWESFWDGLEGLGHLDF